MIHEYVKRAYDLQGGERNDGWPDRKANFKIYTGLKKDDYYNLLADSKVLFNCALQDWVSNTVSEADPFGTLTLYPHIEVFQKYLLTMVGTCTFHGVWKIVLANCLTCLMILEQITKRIQYW